MAGDHSGYTIMVHRHADHIQMSAWSTSNSKYPSTRTALKSNCLGERCTHCTLACQNTPFVLKTLEGGEFLLVPGDPTGRTDPARHSPAFLTFQVAGVAWGRRGGGQGVKQGAARMQRKPNVSAVFPHDATPLVASNWAHLLDARCCTATCV